MFKKIPNVLTLLRVFLIPIYIVFFLLPYDWSNLAAALVFVIACFTDLLDGYLARKNNQVTTLGKFIDPIADKCLTSTMFILLAASQVIPVIPVVVMVWRDTIVDGARMMAAGKGSVMAAGILGKIKTASQMLCIILTLLNNFPFEIMNIPMASVLLWFSMIISVLGGIDYYNQAKPYIWESK